MKKCPSCAYVNRGPGDKCGICGRDLAGVQPLPEEQPRRRRSASDLAPGLILLACGAFALYHGLHRRAAAPAAAAPEKRGDIVFSANGGAVYSLEKLSAQRYLPAADKLEVLRLMRSGRENVAFAAVRAAAALLLAERDDGLKKGFFEGLLKAAASAPPAARRQAALETGFAVAMGFPAAPYADRLRETAAALAAEKDAELAGAGFQLAALAGQAGLEPRMREVLSGPDPKGRLYAACALSRLGDQAGYAALRSILNGGEDGYQLEAVGCLAYSASPEAEPLLRKLAKDEPGRPGLETAKNALIVRKQLAIIKK